MTILGRYWVDQPFDEDVYDGRTSITIVRKLVDANGCWTASLGWSNL